MPEKLYAFVVAYVHNGKGVLFHSTGHYEYTYENTEFQATAQEHFSQHALAKLSYVIVWLYID